MSFGLTPRIKDWELEPKSLADLPRQLPENGGIDRPKMQQALEHVQQGRSCLLAALDFVDRTLTSDREELNLLISDLAGMAIRWQQERDRWQ